MGAWGIYALQSDNGLNAVDVIRDALPADGRVKLEDLMQALKNDEAVCPPKVEDAPSHSSFMALAEVTLKFLERTPGDLDYAAESRTFTSVTSFTASKEALGELREYLAETLRCSRAQEKEMPRMDGTWNGWFKEQDWKNWQEHMEALTARLDELIMQPGTVVQLCKGQSPQQCEDPVQSYSQPAM